MKLSKEYDFIKTQFNNNINKIAEYAPRLKASGKYKNFDVRLTWDCLNAFVGSSTICAWYDKYDCNDEHIATVGKKALKELGII